MRLGISTEVVGDFGRVPRREEKAAQGHELAPVDGTSRVDPQVDRSSGKPIHKSLEHVPTRKTPSAVEILVGPPIITGIRDEVVADESPREDDGLLDGRVEPVDELCRNRAGWCAALHRSGRKADVRAHEL
jgi:hypothetical protein